MGDNVVGNSHAMAGYHDQAILDVNCQRMGFSSSDRSPDNTLNNHDHCTTYDMNLILDLLRTCLQNSQVGFWAKISHDHQFNVNVTDVEALRTGFIRHIFDGDCVLHHGAECKAVVKSGSGTFSMGICVIDAVLTWVEQGVFNTDQLVRICQALDIMSNSKQKVKALRRKLVDRRRDFLNVIDAAAVRLSNLFPQLGSSSSTSMLRSMGVAHNIEISDEEKREEVSSKIFDHVTHGKCMDSAEMAPGCQRLTKDPAVQHMDAIHLQVAVLQHVAESASKKQLCKVLELHEIDYEPMEKKKKLRERLRKYILRIERGKLKVAVANYDTIERLRRLEEIRKHWPNLVPMVVKEKIVRDFRAATSSAALASFTCACCAREQPVSDRTRKSHMDVDLELLSGPSTHWMDPDFPPPPTPFKSGPLGGKILDVGGVFVEAGNIMLELCTSCSRSLNRENLPKHALANKLYTGPVPNELKDLTMIEECMIARARAKSWIVKLQENDSDFALPTAQRGLKGHTIIYPQQPDQLTKILPPPVEETVTFICIIFVGNSKLTAEWLKEKAKPLAVRREKVRNALVWLKSKNPLYKNVEISEQNLNSLPVDDVLPYHIEHVKGDEAQETLTSRYDNAGEERKATNVDATHFESVVIADVDAHTPANQLRAAAVRHAKTKGKSFVQVTHGAHPVNEFVNVEMFPSLYPTLFPYGCGGFEDHSRQKRISMKEHAKALFSWHDKRFQTHNSFLFTVFNILQRRALLLGCTLKVKKASFSRFAESFSSVSSDAVRDVLERIEKGDGTTAHTDEERKVLRLMKEINLVTAKVPGSSAARINMRNEIRALTLTHGMPSFYITINPADTHNPIVKFLAGADIDLDNMLEDDVPNYWEQSNLISSNPALGASFFNTYLKAFIRTVLGCEDEEVNDNEGILGVVKAHYGCVEAQGRGSLHCHMLVWIDGALNPNEIKERVINEPSWGKKLLLYLDDTITNVVPEDPIPHITTVWSEKDPCTLRGARLNTESVLDRLTLRMKDVSRLAERVQRHRHSNTCYKHYKPGQARTCRFDLKEENFRSESYIDSETGHIRLRCLDGLVNNFNMTILEAVRCNMDIQFIGSGESAKAMIYYITDYITKSQLKSHVAYAALQLAVKKCEAIETGDDDFVTRSKRLLQKCAYALISHQEMSAQQVASYLMDYEDHFTSHSFNYLYWASFERFVERCDSEKLLTVMAHGEGAGDIEVDEPVDVAGDENVQPEERNTDGMSESFTDRDTETETFTNEDEEVSIRIDDDGNVTALADQIADYTLRPQELDDMCLWDFVAKTEKVYSRKERERTEDGRNVVVEDDGEEIDVEDVEGRVRHDDVSGDGRKCPRRYRFLPAHKDCEKKHVRLRTRNIVPVPIGPAMPRRDQETSTRYFRLMMILFKPWRKVSELRDLDDSWVLAFEKFSATLHDDHQRVLNNMQVLNECRDSRNDHMQTRVRQRTVDNSKQESHSRAGNDIEDVDMTEVLDHLEDIDRMSSRRQEAATRETHECLDELENAGFFGTLKVVVSAERSVVSEDPLQVDDNTMEDEWRDVYEKRKTEWKLETRHWDCQENVGTTSIVCPDDMEQRHEDAGITINSGVAENEGRGGVPGSVVMQTTVEKWTLNQEQKRAFVLVAGHTLIEKPKQLLMYLGGPGGTGKSRVVNALRDFFEKRNEQRRFRLAAFTGVAARNIGGATLHALLQLSDSGRELSLKGKRDLSAMWDGVDYLFIDELSMLGCEMLHNISRALTEAKGTTDAFGGVNIILAGDFAQLPPIGDTRLYKDINTSCLEAASTNRAQGKILGRLLWLSFETIVFLHETMRQSGEENAEFVELLQRLRDGCCNESDFDVLASRCLRKKTSERNEGDWKFAPVIVTNNATRDAINCRAAEAFAEQTGTELHWYHAIDTHQKVQISDPALIRKLEDQNSGQTKHRLRKIPLVIGMPVAINQNFDVAAGVVNGSHGILRKIRYFTDGDGRRYLRSCVVDIKGSEEVDMPHLPKHNFPVLPDTTELKFEHGGSHRRCTIKRKQVPIEPGFAMTVHKAQGQTMARVIVDLAGCTGTEPPYVMVSRATSLKGLMVLREFDIRQIKKRRSEDLRKEFLRLTILRWKTIAEFGSSAEAEEASKELKSLLSSATERGNKRKADVGRDSMKVSKRKFSR